MADTAGKPITCKAMVAFGVNDLREEDTGSQEQVQPQSEASIFDAVVEAGNSGCPSQSGRGPR